RACRARRTAPPRAVRRAAAVDHERRVSGQHVICHREMEMNTWWWVPIGLAGWFGVSLTVGLLLAQVVRRCSTAREVLDRRAYGNTRPVPKAAHAGLRPPGGI